MYPSFQPRRSLFDSAEENIGLTPEDFFALRQMAQYDPSQQDVDLPIYQPEHAMSDQFGVALQGMPQRENPGKMRKFLAMISGLDEVADAISDRPTGRGSGGLQAADQILNEPYYKKLEDWKMKTGNLKEGAELENRRNINSRMLNTQTESNRIRQQNADTAIKRAEDIANKTKQDYEFKDRESQRKISELEEKARQADNKLNLATDVATQRQGNAEAQLNFKKAELDAEKAKWNLDRAQRDKQLSEQTRLHDVMKTKWEEENKDRDTRLSQYETQLGINQQKADKTNSGERTTTRETKDASGKITGTTVTKTQTGKTAEPKIGDKKTFPNGNVGEWDGKGWKLVGK